MLHLSAYKDGTGGPYCDADTGRTTNEPDNVECERCLLYLEEARKIEEPSLEKIRRDLEMRTAPLN